MENGDASREEIASTLTSIPCQLSSADINDFFSLAHYYASKTPQSFRKVRVMYGTLTSPINSNIILGVCIGARKPERLLIF